MQIKRIDPPMFKINDELYNEYELRQLMLDIATKEYVSELPITVTDSKGNVAKICKETGRISDSLDGFTLSDDLATELFYSAVFTKEAGVPDWVVRYVDKLS